MPVDTIMDMLGSEECRIAILNYYNCTQERVAVCRAIEDGKNGTESGTDKQKKLERQTLCFISVCLQQYYS